MALWPFGRKKRKTNEKGDSSMITSATKAEDLSRLDPRRSLTDVNSSRVNRKPSRKTSQRRTRSKSRVLTKTPPATARELEGSTPVPPVPPMSRPATDAPEAYNEKSFIASRPGPSRTPLAEVPTNREDIPSYYFQNPTSQQSIQPEKFSALDSIPTLRARRSVQDSSLPRRKSSKRKAEDHAREREIKALSAPIPIPKRPQSNAGGVLVRDTKRVPGGLNRNLERPTSEISLPIADSLHSSGSAAPDTQAFKISAFDVLSPRPTIKYAENPRTSNNFGPSRTSTRKEKRPSITEENFNSRERIDNLADEFDAGGIRELMERDRRRRENKRRTDREKLQRKLQRRSDKQRADGTQDQTASEDATNRQNDALGIEFGEASTSRAEDQGTDPDRQEAKSPESWLEDASRENEPLENPFSDPMGETRLEPPTPEEKDEPVIETAKAIRLSTASMSPPTSPIHAHARQPSNLSTLDDLASPSSPDVQDRLQPETARRGSDTSSRMANSWTSFFRRSGVRGTRASADRGRATPSEFSNTSRDSLAKQVPPPAFVRNVQPPRSGTPVRTQSKFREDLPELPISPPMSRVQSPELEGRGSPFIDHASKVETLTTGDVEAEPRLSDVHPAYREEVVLSRNASLRGPSPENPSDAILSQSLASVDSEASWLSGRPQRRSSQQMMNPMRTSGGSLSHHVQEKGSSEEARREAPGTTYNRRSSSPQKPGTPGGVNKQMSPRKEPTAVESDDEEEAASPDEAVKMNAVVGRRPTIVSRSERAKSREGLLTEFHSLEDSPASSPSAYSPEDQQGQFQDASPSVHRATSVDLGKAGHARHISAGSARLLNLPPRSSGELKRMSTASAERSPLPSPLGLVFADARSTPPA